MNNIYLNYGDIIKSLKDFRKVDHEGFNRFDSPANLYFRIVFYFNEDQGLLGLNGMSFDENSNVFEETIARLKAPFTANENANDEAPKENEEPKINIRNFEGIKNTAYHFLLLNDELDRAYMLKKFVILLSEISSKSPWYFSSISGLDGALERKMFDKEFKIEEERKAITIKCLPDAYDNRIGTLLELYRQICYSYTMKKEIVPANLRKFNMGVLIFNQPIRGLGGKGGDNAKIYIPESAEEYYIPSCKLIELRQCEIDQNSVKTAFGELKTEEPLSPEYTITIKYDDAYVSQYNEIMQYVITDFINTDVIKENVEGYSNIHGQTPEGKRSLKLLHGGESFKGYWTDRDTDEKIYENSFIENSDNKDIRDINDTNSSNPIVNQLSKAKNHIKDITYPSKVSKRNIHDVGTVNHIGSYEYLNKIKKTSGLINSAIDSAIDASVSKPIKDIKSKITQILTGNIYGHSVKDYLGYASKFIQGDYSGAIADIKRKSGEETKKTGLEGKKLPQYEQEKMEILRKYNEKKSIYNNI